MARILVVDDDDVARLLVGELLETGGYGVAYAADGDTALALYREQPFAAVVLDVVMPGLSGLDTLRALRELDTDVRVIMVSGARDADLMLARDLGAIATLPKPIDHAELLGAIRSVIAP
jgi:DNA-binding response OmpR family regulator